MARSSSISGFDVDVFTINAIGAISIFEFSIRCNMKNSFLCSRNRQGRIRPKNFGDRVKSFFMRLVLVNFGNDLFTQYCDETFPQE